MIVIRLLTLPSKLQIDHIGHFQVDHSQKPLILLPLELPLVKNLDRNDRRVLDGAIHQL